MTLPSFRFLESRRIAAVSVGRHLSQIVGIILLGFFYWDANAYFLHVPLPSFVFWLGALPVALGFYCIFGMLLLMGRLEVKRNPRYRLLWERDEERLTR